MIIARVAAQRDHRGGGHRGGRLASAPRRRRRNCSGTGAAAARSAAAAARTCASARSSRRARSSSASVTAGSISSRRRARPSAIPIAVPREESRWAGTTSVTNKRINPSWTPTPTMMAENPRLPRWVPGGHPMNPLGVRALYLGSSTYRIHGTDAPWTIGTAVSKGCIRMYNQDVLDLYPRATVGAKVTRDLEPLRRRGHQQQQVAAAAAAAASSTSSATTTRRRRSRAPVRRAPRAPHRNKILSSSGRQLEGGPSGRPFA